MAKKKFIATCPLTGETRTRSTDHEYTHALSIKRTKVAKAVGEWIYFIKAHQVPKGFTIISKCGSRMKGSAVRLEQIPQAEQKTEIVSLISFHHTKALAQASAGQYRYGGMYEIEAVVVPCQLVEGK
jgi:hypothetical protein